jgi:hypothetical protein
VLNLCGGLKNILKKSSSRKQYLVLLPKMLAETVWIDIDFARGDVNEAQIPALYHAVNSSPCYSEPLCYGLWVKKLDQ